MNTTQQTIGSCVEDKHEIDTETIEVVSSVSDKGFEVEADCAECDARRHEYAYIGSVLRSQFHINDYRTSSE